MEEISAYFDGESSSPERLRTHLAECPRCRACLESLARMDFSIRKRVRQETGTDREISEKILARVKKELPSGRKSFLVRRFPSPVLWRAACLFLIAGATGYFSWSEYRESKRIPRETSVAPSAAVPASISPVSSRPVQLSDLSGIRFSSDGAGLPFSSGQPYQPIRDYVRHVWVFSGDAEQALRRILKEVGLPETCMKRSADGIDVAFKGEKIRAVRFVKACAAAGFRLLSPDQPQPEQTSFTGRADEPVLYRAAFPGKDPAGAE